VRILDLNSRLVDCLKAALGETGCDGDLCSHRWHEIARGLFSEVEESIAAQPRNGTHGKLDNYNDGSI
jgi:hypothetical protein